LAAGNARDFLITEGRAATTATPSAIPSMSVRNALAKNGARSSCAAKAEIDAELEDELPF
jgi:hypothetical protein